ncbi:hypothetical protein ACM01_14965 [Streptomyces viridochromogenes]|uniref:Uncharacterized protein n=1 Tax=Streptomyces viridochromogenes TaxID=1938 RepID=A0A0J7ZGB5_STRVR|nr:hypothetical protein [Streptomyces viridochromogenes]KMS74218.1 hypothetical protein ACM01_14965 [Streptomyces viridochromogenes]
MPGKDPDRSRRLQNELWAPRINAAEGHKERVVVLLDMARARLPESDPVWEALDRQLGRYLEEALGAR